MSKVVIVTDSTCDLQPEMIKKHNIVVIPLYVTFDHQDTFKDGVEITVPELYKRVQENGTLPKSSAPGPKDFVDAFKPIIEAGNDLVYMGIGGGFSGTLQNAYIASKEFPENRIFLVDSCNLSSATGLLVLKACKFAEEGMDAKTIKSKIEELVPKVHAQFCIDSFEYLYKGGRCNGISKLLGTVLKIKPIIRVVSGKMIVADKPRGRKMALDNMIKDTLSHVEGIHKDHVFITHSLCNQEDLDYIKERLQSSIDVNIDITEAGCVISTHCGKETVGILYISD